MLALLLSLVLFVQVRRVRAAQRVVMGEHGSEDLVAHAASVQQAFLDLHDRVEEVAAHLDPLRREALFERLRTGRAQVWLTGTEPAPFSAIAGEAAIWRVASGRVPAVPA